MGHPGGREGLLDLGLAATPGDGRVGRRLTGGFHHVLDAGPGRAGYDVELLSWHSGAHEYHGRDTRHRLVKAVRNLEVAHDNLGACVGQRLALVRIAHQHAHGHVALGEQACGFGADLSRRRYQDHRCLRSPGQSEVHNPVRCISTGLSNPVDGYHDLMVDETGARPRLTARGERARSRIIKHAARLIHEGEPLTSRTP